MLRQKRRNSGTDRQSVLVSLEFVPRCICLECIEFLVSHLPGPESARPDQDQRGSWMSPPSRRTLPSHSCSLALLHFCLCMLSILCIQSEYSLTHSACVFAFVILLYRFSHFCHSERLSNMLEYMYRFLFLFATTAHRTWFAEAFLHYVCPYHRTFLQHYDLFCILALLQVFCSPCPLPSMSVKTNLKSPRMPLSCRKVGK